MGACVLCDKLPVVCILPDSRKSKETGHLTPLTSTTRKTGLRLLLLNSSGMSVHLSCLGIYFSKVRLNFETSLELRCIFCWLERPKCYEKTFVYAVFFSILFSLFRSALSSYTKNQVNLQNVPLQCCDRLWFELAYLLHWLWDCSEPANIKKNMSKASASASTVWGSLPWFRFLRLRLLYGQSL